jgi:hypothetical protein
LTTKVHVLLAPHAYCDAPIERLPVKLPTATTAPDESVASDVTLAVEEPYACAHAPATVPPPAPVAVVVVAPPPLAVVDEDDAPPPPVAVDDEDPPPPPVAVVVDVSPPVPLDADDDDELELDEVEAPPVELDDALAPPDPSSHWQTAYLSPDASHSCRPERPSEHVQAADCPGVHG